MTPNHNTDLDQFTRDYTECALWSSTDDKEQPMGTSYSVSDIAPDTLARMVADCQRFQTENAELLAKSGLEYDSIAHDFWLNRNSYGSGFWDEYSQTSCDAYNAEQAIAIGSRDFSKRDALDQTCECVYHVCQRLSEATKAFGSFDLYIGDGGQIHGSPL